MTRLSDAELRGELAARWGGAPIVARAPGRVNLIGEHTDYNDGFVLPAALDRGARVAAAPRRDRVVRAASRNCTGEHRFELDAPPRREGTWGDYVTGVATHLERHGVALGGADLLIDSDVPLGAGLSSSAALEVAVARALLEVAGTALPPLTMARLCQTAEHEFAGTECGIMDQYAACFGSPAALLLLDCRALSHRLVTLPPGACLLICNSMVRHQLASGEYNRRRAECAAAVLALRDADPHITSLRDVTSADVEARRDRLPPPLDRRARHVTTENERVLAAAEALRRDDLTACGRVLYASHESLRRDYEVSCPELDALVELAAEIPGVYGARMTGGGFGGCTVNLVDGALAPAIATELAQRYAAATGRSADTYLCAATS